MIIVLLVVRTAILCTATDVLERFIFGVSIRPWRV